MIKILNLINGTRHIQVLPEVFTFSDVSFVAMLVQWGVIFFSLNTRAKLCYPARRQRRPETKL